MNVPVRIEIDKTKSTITLHWSDVVPRLQKVHCAVLRNVCPCSGCRRVRLSNSFTPVSDDVQIVDIRSMGYGVQLVFSDGHDRGIFPWVFLETLDEDVS